MESENSTVSKLQGLIGEHNVERIEVYRYWDTKLHHHSRSWCFGHEFIQVGEHSYNLGRLVRYNLVDQTLRLYF